MAKLTGQEITRVKGMGFLLNRGTENFSGRIVPAAGVFTADRDCRMCAAFWQRQGGDDQPPHCGADRYPV